MHITKNRRYFKKQKVYKFNFLSKDNKTINNRNSSNIKYKDRTRINHKN